MILVDESSETEAYLGPKLLIPYSPKVDVVFSDINITKVTLKSHQESAESSDDSESDEEEDVCVDNVEDDALQQTSYEPLEDEILICDDELPDDVRRYLEMFPSQSKDVVEDVPIIGSTDAGEGGDVS